MTAPRIRLVGFEIEGGWNGTRGVSPFPDLQLIADHSINGQGLRTARAIAATHIGEAVSPPLDYLIQDWRGWLVTHWPNAAPEDRTNRTCGFHIHISLHSLRDYALLTSKTFVFGLRDRLLEVGRELTLPSKHVFWERMNGRNNFCELFYDPALQMKITSKTGVNRVRYGWMNFSWGLHGTAEFRALPTFRDAHVGVRFAEEYFAFVQRYLDARAGEELVREATFLG